MLIRSVHTGPSFVNVDRFQRRKRWSRSLIGIFCSLTLAYLHGQGGNTVHMRCKDQLNAEPAVFPGANGFDSQCRDRDATNAPELVVFTANSAAPASFDLRALSEWHH
jgi:hypothetical protein